MTHTQRAPVYGHTLSSPRPTLWAPFLLAGLLSLPVLVVTVVLALVP